MATKNQRMKSENVELTTPEFRAGFPFLFEPRKSDRPGSKPKYGITMLFQIAETEQSKKEKRPVVSIAPLQALVRDVLIEKYGPDRTKWPPFATNPEGEAGKILLPFRSGEEFSKKNADGTWKPGFGPGIAFAKAESLNKPGVVYPWADPANPEKPAVMTVPSDFYGGCYARAVVNAYHWEYMGKFGVSLSLQNVQKVRDGEPFGGRTAAEDAFEAIEPPQGGAAVPAGAQAAAPAAAGAFGV